MKIKLLIICLLLSTRAADPAAAWGPEGHRVIGEAAVNRLAPDRRAELAALLGAADTAELDSAVATACFWPDTVRDDPAWSWSAPLHYVNIPRHATAYERQRDCPDGQCVTEGILRFAAALDRPQRDHGPRREAFAWLCHLVADLHQPLHAGFRDDRGGNRVAIEYRGESLNLHQFWDSALARERRANTAGLPDCADADDAPWNPADVAAWTTESHTLAVTAAYPPGRVIDASFAEQSWALINSRWCTAAGRLAAVLEAVLGADG